MCVPVSINGCPPFLGILDMSAALSICNWEAAALLGMQCEGEAADSQLLAAEGSEPAAAGGEAGSQASSSSTGGGGGGSAGTGGAPSRKAAAPLGKGYFGSIEFESGDQLLRPSSAGSSGSSDAGSGGAAGSATHAARGQHGSGAGAGGGGGAGAGGAARRAVPPHIRLPPDVERQLPSSSGGGIVLPPYTPASKELRNAGGTAADAGTSGSSSSQQQPGKRRPPPNQPLQGLNRKAMRVSAVALQRHTVSASQVGVTGVQGRGAGGGRGGGLCCVPPGLRVLPAPPPAAGVCMRGGRARVYTGT